MRSSFVAAIVAFVLIDAAVVWFATRSAPPSAPTEPPPAPGAARRTDVFRIVVTSARDGRPIAGARVAGFLDDADVALTDAAGAAEVGLAAYKTWVVVAPEDEVDRHLYRVVADAAGDFVFDHAVRGTKYSLRAEWAPGAWGRLETILAPQDAAGEQNVEIVVTRPH